MSDTPTPDQQHAMQQQQASQAYKNSSLNALSDREVMAEAMRVIITNLYQAKDAYLARNLEKMLEHTTKILHIVHFLAATLETSGALKDPESKKSALVMANLYNDLVRRVTNVLRAADTAAEFDALIEKVKPIYRSWHPDAADAAAGA